MDDFHLKNQTVYEFLLEISKDIFNEINAKI